jgi:hypothetical protein
MRILLHLIAAAFIAGAVPACGGMSPSTSGASTSAWRATSQPLRKKKTGKLLTLDTNTSALEYWPIQRSGGSTLHELVPQLGIYRATGMAAAGTTVVIANYSPAEIFAIDVARGIRQIYPDPYGGPLDVAVGKDGTIYALHLDGSVTADAGSLRPARMSCAAMTDAVAIAVDNESDVFINGYGPHGFMGVAEFAAGSTQCKVLTGLRKERGYAGGIGIDPKTDDLIVVDNPDYCAGGLEGRMFIYAKPYGSSAVRRRKLDADYCAGTFRLDATSTHIFVADATVDDGAPLIDQRTYPGARGTGTYQDGPSGYSGDFSGFTTIPNTLPN